ncbi:MAG TPA: peptide-methionine (S)-S-oxide reductase MsrA [Casimicrobiaceae bacterium]|nr:peptide-methionine (S)-S-oxide reductase MsrA [Casimicrobiaceae bacterium]
MRNARKRLATIFCAVLAWGLAFPAAAQTPANPPGTAVATFAGGCFWCMEPPFDKIPGVVKTTSGYTGGFKRNPNYEDVSSGTTGHAEAVQIVYDPTKVSYRKLLDVFWHNIDPTVTDRQFCDHGNQYRTAIFVHDAEQRRLAEASKVEIEKTKTFKDPIVTPIIDAGEFWPAEEYHQDYYLKNPVRYNYYRTGCGRDARLKQLWGTSSH